MAGTEAIFCRVALRLPGLQFTKYYFASIACSIVRAIASGWLTIDTWLAETSVVFAWIVFAIARSRSGLIIRSFLLTTNQLGLTCHAAWVTFSPNASALIGPCVAAIAVCSSGFTSGAKSFLTASVGRYK